MLHHNRLWLTLDREQNTIGRADELAQSLSAEEALPAYGALHIPIAILEGDS